MKLKPIDDRVVVELIEAESVSKGGIVIHDNAKEKSRRGMVTAVGPGRILESGDRLELTVSVGDEVLFNEYSGVEIEKGIKVIRESDILGIVESK